MTSPRSCSQSMAAARRKTQGSILPSIRAVLCVGTALLRQHQPGLAFLKYMRSKRASSNVVPDGDGDIVNHDAEKDGKYFWFLFGRSRMTHSCHIRMTRFFQSISKGRGC